MAAATAVAHTYSTAAGPLQQNTLSVQKQQAEGSEQHNKQSQSSDLKVNSCPQLPLPFPGMAPFMMPPFGRMPFPMFPMMPGMVPPLGSGKSIPAMPMMFPHPAQLQAMSQAAQAAMAQAANQPGSLPPFPLSMMPPVPMMQQPAAACAQASASNPQACQPGAVADEAPGQLAGKADPDEDDEEGAGLDENVELEPELELLFDKVAAMEREKAQQQQQLRAGSPCASIYSAATGQPSISSNPCSPSSATALQQPSATAICSEAAPVPWLSFAADDKVDDLDADLAQLISLPVEVPASNGSDTIASTAVATMGQPNTSLKRVSSTCSAHSSDELLTGATAAALAGTKSASGKGNKSKVLRIRSIKGASTSSAGKPASGVSRSSAKAPVAPASKATNSKAASAQKKASACGLAAAKAGVQKKSGASSTSNKVQSTTADRPASTAKPASAAATVKQQQCQKLTCSDKQWQQQQHHSANSPAAELDLLGDLAELESGLSDTCFGSSGDDMGIDSFEYLDSLLQGSSEDAWDGLLGVTCAADDGMELCSALGVN